jgi:hypothetical protein
MQREGEKTLTLIGDHSYLNLIHTCLREMNNNNTVASREKSSHFT